jgi:2-(1,2-epoxy-1,2-dihydrophenyl)acetyl-CoA isomerase
VEPLVKYHLEDGVGVISLNRPDKHNAINNEMSRSSREAWDWALGNDDVRVIVIRGEGSRSVRAATQRSSAPAKAGTRTTRSCAARS